MSTSQLSHKTNESAIDPLPESTIKLIPSPQDDIKFKQLLTYFPITYWLPKYKIKSYLLHDIIAGLTAGIMLIPQGMGYSLIASLNPVYGLYGSMFGPLLYSFFGTSGQLSVAPVAIVSLLVGEALETQLHNIEFESESSYNLSKLGMASAMAFQVGIIQIFIGLLHGGLIANLLSHSVILGFTCSAAILIGLSQIKYIFGIDIPRGEFIEMLINLFKNLNQTHWQSFVMSICAIIFLLILNYWKKSKKKLWGQKYAQFIPGPLIVVVISILIVWSTDNKAQLEIIGDIQNGLPKPINFFDTIPSMDIFWGLWTTSLMIALIAFIESYAIANKFAEQRGYRIDASQELIANGIPNLFGSFFQIYPVTGGLSRTAVVNAADGQTPLNSFICGVFMILVLSLLLFLFKYLPLCVLGAIILVSVYNLFDYKGMIDLWRVKRKDFYVAFITFILTLFLGVELGVAVGIIASITMFIQRAMMPHYAVLGKVSFDNGKNIIYRNIKNYEQSVIRDDMLIIRWDASLFFGNMFMFKTKVNKQILKKIKHDMNRQLCLLLCFSGVNDIDATAAHDLYTYLKDIMKKYDQLTIVFTNIKKPVKIVLENVEIIELIGKDKIFYEIDEAEEWWNDEIHEIHEEEDNVNTLLVKSNHNEIDLNINGVEKINS